MSFTAHIDTFARDRLPPREQWPEFLFESDALRFPERVNCGAELLDRAVASGRGDRICLREPGGLVWTYAELLAQSNRIANVLTHEMGLVPGNRVLLRAPNNAMLVACWFAVVRAGGVAVGTMPLLRAKELGQVIAKAEISHALCDATLDEELTLARSTSGTLRELRCYGSVGPHSLDAAMQRHSASFNPVPTAAEDTCMLAFTSGTTGLPKATMHFHRDVLAACACWPPHVLRASADDLFVGSPPLAFTYGLGGLVLFPMSIGASALLLEKANPPALLDAIQQHAANVLFTSPTSYRAMAAQAQAMRLGVAHGGPLRKCVSAGEVLPASTRTLWKDSTGIELIDGIGATEMLHIFISADEQHARPGATGVVVPGYQACVMGDDGRPAPVGTIGKLAVKGPTGCRYLDDERQRQYVKDGWNYTGDAYLMDADGYFHYQSRTDDMIVSAGYNIGAPEVEEALMAHPAVAECAVIGVPDSERGQIVKAFVVLKPGQASEDALVRTLQDFVKATIAPYKYPRAIEFRPELPRTATGKLQRFRLRDALTEKPKP
ncbi:MAG: AMP-binding protein [Rhizobacter sp.]|nr:AMP-binding protein [Rhizobacter sp.]